MSNNLTDIYIGNIEYIRKTDALDVTWKQPSYTDPLNVLTEVRDRIKSIKPVDVAPVVHAKWIYHPNWELDGECAYQCPKCQMGSDINHNYCMRCGAKMDGWVYEGEE